MYLYFYRIFYPYWILEHVGTWLTQCITSDAGILCMGREQLGESMQQPCTSIAGQQGKETLLSNRVWEFQAVVAQKGL